MDVLGAAENLDLGLEVEVRDVLEEEEVVPEIVAVLVLVRLFVLLWLAWL